MIHIVQNLKVYKGLRYQFVLIIMALLWKTDSFFIFLAKGIWQPKEQLWCNIIFWTFKTNSFLQICIWAFRLFNLLGPLVDYFYYWIHFYLKAWVTSQHIWCMKLNDHLCLVPFPAVSVCFWPVLDEYRRVIYLKRTFVIIFIRTSVFLHILVYYYKFVIDFTNKKQKVTQKKEGYPSLLKQYKQKRRFAKLHLMKVLRLKHIEADKSKFFLNFGYVSPFSNENEITFFFVRQKHIFVRSWFIVAAV